MNVLEVYYVFLPVKGGVQRHIYDLCKCMIHKGHKPIVLTWIPSEPSSESIDGITVHRVKIPFLLRRTRYPIMLCLLFYIAYVVIKYDVDLIHAHDYLPSLPSAIAGGLLRKPVVATFHLPIWSTTWIPAYVSPFEFLLKRCFMRFVSVIICVSKFTYYETVKLGFPKSKMKVIYNWMTTFPKRKIGVEDVLKKFNLNQERFILSVGRLEEKQKGFSMLIYAFKLLIDKGHDLDLVIVGDGPARKLYDTYCVKLGVSRRVHLLRQVGDADLECLYKGCEFFVLPSRLESLSLVLLEAMNFGKPVVATRVGGIPEVIEDGYNGILVDLNSSSLALGIETLLLNPHLKDVLAERSCKTIEKFSESNCFETVNLLESLCQE